MASPTSRSSCRAWRKGST
uniref:Uncharacterized protein n=1 Tax=Arundo donax TaxID=35708 RepID=A0A0A9A2W9_ARUDO